MQKQLHKTIPKVKGDNFNKGNPGDKTQNSTKLFH